MKFHNFRAVPMSPPIQIVFENPPALDSADDDVIHHPGRVNASLAWHVYTDRTKRYLCQFVTDVPKPLPHFFPHSKRI